MAAVGRRPQPGLRSMLPRGYVGFTEATTPRQLVLPATTFVPLVVKLLDSAHRPPAFVMGARGSSLVLEGDCAPSYLEVVLSPLGAYRVLGLPMAELGGQLVDLVEVLGRLEGGPRPAPEVAWAWERLVSSGGAVPIGRLAREVGWSHKHLIARFGEQVGLRPKLAARLVRFEGVWRRLDQVGGAAGLGAGGR